MRGERRFDRGAHRPGLPGAREEVEVERRVQFVRAQVAREPLRIGQPDLSDQYALFVEAVCDCAPGAVDLMQLVPIHERVLTRRRIGRLLAERGILDEQRRRVDAHACDAAIEPKAQNVLVLDPDIEVRPVEIGLLGGEQMEVPLAVVDARPRGPSEDRLPAVRRIGPLLTLPGPEPEPVALGRAGRRGESLLEPAMFARDVIGHDIDDRANPELARLGDQLLGFVERPERRVDRAIVDNVVPVVGERRGIPGAEPEGVDAEVAQIGKLGAHTGEVADPVPVPVGEAPNVDLVDDRVAPPGPLRTVGAGRGLGDRTG